MFSRGMNQRPSPPPWPVLVCPLAESCVLSQQPLLALEGGGLGRCHRDLSLMSCDAAARGQTLRLSQPLSVPSSRGTGPLLGAHWLVFLAKFRFRAHSSLLTVKRKCRKEGGWGWGVREGTAHCP